LVPRILATTMLGSPGGFSGGSGSRLGAGGSSLSRIAFRRGMQGKLKACGDRHKETHDRVADRALQADQDKPDEQRDHRVFDRGRASLVISERH
jgi:hypothetical protein